MRQLEVKKIQQGAISELSVALQSRILGDSAANLQFISQVPYSPGFALYVPK